VETTKEAVTKAFERILNDLALKTRFDANVKEACLEQVLKVFEMGFAVKPPKIRCIVTTDIEKQRISVEILDPLGLFQSAAGEE
jgi:hypothetical protein